MALRLRARASTGYICTAFRGTCRAVGQTFKGEGEGEGEEVVCG